MATAVGKEAPPAHRPGGVNLFDRCRNGDKEAWHAVYNHVLAAARTSRCRDLFDSPEDFAHDVVVRLLRRINTLEMDDSAAFEGYIRQVIGNLIRDLLRKKKHRPSIEPLMPDDPENDGPQNEPESPEPGPDAIVFGQNCQEMLAAAMETLSESCQEALQGYFDYKAGGHLSMAALAQAIGVKLGTLSARINRCLGQLKNIPAVSEWLSA